MINLFNVLCIVVSMLPWGQDTDEPAKVPEAPSHVIVISMDGARPDAIQSVRAPVLQRLAEEGAVAWDAQTIFPPATVPAHASLLTGLAVDDHGVNHNSYSTEKLELPTFLSIASEANIPTGMIVGKNKLDQFHYPQSVHYEFATSGDGSVIDVAIDRLNAGDQLLFIHMPNPDYFGHSSGWMSSVYLYELQNTDYHIGRLLAVMEEMQIMPTSLIIITADHGGHGVVHGADIAEDMTIPLIVYGLGVPGRTVLEDVSIVNVAATVLEALDLPLPDQVTSSLWDQISGEQDSVTQAG